MENKKHKGTTSANKATIIQKAKQKREWSKQLIADVRILLWVVTLGGLYLAWKCIDQGYLGSLPCVTSMVGLPWAAHGTICSFYLNMAKSDHREGGITYEQAKANNFRNVTEASINSPQI
jgi:hypothetical protein